MNVTYQQPKIPLLISGIVLMLLLLFSVSFSGSDPVLHFFGLSKINGTVFFVSRLLYWFCLLIMWLYAVNIEKQNLLIWQDRKYNFKTYLLSGIVLFAALALSMVVLHIILALLHIKEAESSKLQEMIAIFRANKLQMIFTALTAGVVEELLLRGYLQPRLQIILKNSYAAIIISSLIFGLLHYRYGTIINMAGPFIIGLIFAIYYWKYRNIKILVICHFLWDLLALITH